MKLLSVILFGILVLDSSIARPQSSANSAAQSDEFCPPLDPTNCYKKDKTRRDSANASANQNDQPAAQSAPVQAKVGGALNDQEANDQPAQQEASRRSNMNVQSGIQQHGNGNMNSQTSVQQFSSRRNANSNLQAALQQMSRRSNMNSQADVQQTGSSNSNIQSGVQQSSAPSRRSNMNVQSGIQQFGNGNTNMQGNIQQQSSRRGNMNSQTGIQQKGDDNMNAQQSVQQSSQQPQPASRRADEWCPPLDPTNCYKNPKTRRGNMNVQSGIQQMGNGNMNAQQSVQQSSQQPQPSSRRTNSETTPLCGFLDPTGCYKEKPGQRSNFNAQSDVQQIDYLNTGAWGPLSGLDNAVGVKSVDPLESYFVPADLSAGKNVLGGVYGSQGQNYGATSSSYEQVPTYGGSSGGYIQAPSVGSGYSLFGGQAPSVYTQIPNNFNQAPLSYGQGSLGGSYGLNGVGGSFGQNEIGGGYGQLQGSQIQSGNAGPSGWENGAQRIGPYGQPQYLG